MLKQTNTGCTNP